MLHSRPHGICNTLRSKVHAVRHGEACHWLGCGLGALSRNVFERTCTELPGRLYTVYSVLQSVYTESFSTYPRRRQFREATASRALCSPGSVSESSLKATKLGTGRGIWSPIAFFVCTFLQLAITELSNQLSDPFGSDEVPACRVSGVCEFCRSIGLAELNTSWVLPHDTFTQRVKCLVPSFST